GERPRPRDRTLLPCVRVELPLLWAAVHGSRVRTVGHTGRDVSRPTRMGGVRLGSGSRLGCGGRSMALDPTRGVRPPSRPVTRPQVSSFIGPSCSFMKPESIPWPMKDPVVPRMLEVPGGKMAYEEGGRGRPVVLLHEGIADRRMWNREFALLARDHRVVRYDLRGYGSSAPATSKYSPVRDLVALLDHLRVARPLIVGPSMGGKIALDLTLAYPERVGALLLIAPGYSGMDYDHV